MKVKTNVEFMIWISIPQQKRLEQRNRRLKKFNTILRSQHDRFIGALAKRVSEAVERAILYGLPAKEEE